MFEINSKDLKLVFEDETHAKLNTILQNIAIVRSHLKSEDVSYLLKF